MKKMMLTTGLAVLAFMPLAQAAEGAPVSETTTEVVTDGQTTVVTTGTETKTEAAAPTSAQTTVIVEEESKLRDAITGEPVEEKAAEEKEDMSLRDKVRSKME